MKHLIGHGHTRIGFVGNLAQADIHDRYAGYLHALQTHNLPTDLTLVFTVPNNDWGGGVRAAHNMLDSLDIPTAVMVATDRNTIGLMRTLNDAGLTIPRDIAVVGFDNIEASAFSTPTLSSVSQRFDEVGALAQIRGEAVSFTPPTSCRPRRSSFEGPAGAPLTRSAPGSEETIGRWTSPWRSCAKSFRTRTASRC